LIKVHHQNDDFHKITADFTYLDYSLN